MQRPFKYASLFQQHNISLTCPGNDLQEYELEAFRWYRTDWSHQDNFLPNLLQPVPPRTITDENRCGYCGISFYTSLEVAIKKFSSMPQRVQKILGHSKIYKGRIEFSDGMSNLHDSHVNLYEYAEVDIAAKFQENGTL